MALYKRNNIWWLIISHYGKRIQRSTGTSDKVAAQRYHDQVKADLWKVEYLHEKPEYTWCDAAVRWLAESKHKRSLDDDKFHLRWLDPHLRKLKLRDVNRDMIDRITRLKLQEGVKSATVNRIRSHQSYPSQG
jgi:hypothetical protein